MRATAAVQQSVVFRQRARQPAARWQRAVAACLPPRSEKEACAAERRQAAAVACSRRIRGGSACKCGRHRCVRVARVPAGGACELQCRLC